jgi:hypothetical protein
METVTTLPQSGAPSAVQSGFVLHAPNSTDGAPVDDSTLSVNAGNYLERHLRRVIDEIEGKSLSNSSPSASATT